MRQKKRIESAIYYNRYALIGAVIVTPVHLITMIINQMALFGEYICQR